VTRASEKALDDELIEKFGQLRLRLHVYAVTVEHLGKEREMVRRMKRGRRREGAQGGEEGKTKGIGN